MRRVRHPSHPTCSRSIQTDPDRTSTIIQHSVDTGHQWFRPVPPCAQLTATLQASAECRRWLLTRWAEFRILLEHGIPWDTPALLRFIRLRGKNVAESVYDPALNIPFVAWDVLVPGFAAEERENFREERFRTDPSFNHRQCWSAIVRRPGNAAEAREILYALIEDHVENLKELLASNEAMEAIADPDWADRAALDLSAGSSGCGDTSRPRCGSCSGRWRRCASCGRGDWGGGNEQEEMADGKCQMADEECQVAQGELLVSDERCKAEVGGGDGPEQSPARVTTREKRRTKPIWN